MGHLLGACLQHLSAFHLSFSHVIIPLPPFFQLHPLCHRHSVTSNESLSSSSFFSSFLSFPLLGMILEVLEADGKRERERAPSKGALECGMRGMDWIMTSTTVLLVHLRYGQTFQIMHPF